MEANDKDIIYSTKIFEEEKDAENSNTKNYNIIIRELKRKKEENKFIWTVVLNYEIDGKPQEVIMGTLGDTNERKAKAKKIIELIEKQLKENSMEKDGYKSFEQLSKYVKNENIPFLLTMEGMDILSTKSKDKTLIEKTVSESRHGEMQSKFTLDEMKKKKEEKNAQLAVYIREQRKLEKWKERRTKILENLEPSKREAFLEGERITQFIQDQEINIISKRDTVVRYLTEENEGIEDKENPKAILVKGYIKLKEKGIAIDTKKTLEEIENEYYKNIRENSGEITEKQYKGLEILDNYKNFFDLVKLGKDWNARLVALKLKKINFEPLGKLFGKYRGEDTELLEYFKLKEKMVKETGTDTIELEYNQNDSVRELYDFLLYSSIRKETAKDDEFFISRIYDERIKRELLEYNYENIELYNYYAQKSGINIYELPEIKSKNIDKNKVPKVVKEISDGLYIDEKQKKQQQEQERETDEHPEK